MSYLSSSSSSSDFTDSDFSTPGTTRRRRYGRIYESDTSSEDSWSDDTSDEMTKRVRFCSPLPRSNNGCNIRTQRIPVSADISSPATRTDIGSGFGDRGQLKLVICGTARKLTVTFLGVRSLHKSYTRSGSYPHYIYLKISLSPDTENRVRHKTSPKCLTSDTLSVHESFSFDITRRDIGKRILISAWSKCEAYDRSMFIGCMSFGVKRIVSN
uniref:C2 domain-containing protein n=2 Tax=Ciona intestinalis TaxID=7719 RepID=F7AT57_CIOIN